MDARARLLVLFAIASTTTAARAQDSTRVLTAARFQGVVRIDAVLDDSAWASAQVATNFRQREPSEGAQASLPTKDASRDAYRRPHLQRQHARSVVGRGVAGGDAHR